MVNPADQHLLAVLEHLAQASHAKAAGAVGLDLHQDSVAVHRRPEPIRANPDRSVRLIGYDHCAPASSDGDAAGDEAQALGESEAVFSSSHDRAAADELDERRIDGLLGLGKVLVQPVEQQVLFLDTAEPGQDPVRERTRVAVVAATFRHRLR
jgi:hypothetical protein